NQFSGDVSVLFGRGDGSFQTAVNYRAGTTPVSIGVGDFNGDGRCDLVVGTRGMSGGVDTNNVYEVLARADGTFQPPVKYETGTVPASVAVGDFNGDGKPDLAVGDWD